MSLSWLITARNRARIRRIAATAPSDLEALARLFEDDGILDDGTLLGRTHALLRATERRTIPGLQTGVFFGDTGFRGDQRLGGQGYRDPWESSRNQVGHFLTAIRLQLAPEVVSRPIPLLGSIRRIVAAPDDMDDAEVALRLSIGHEKSIDPLTVPPVAILVLAAALGAHRRARSAGVAREERLRWVAAAALAELRRQVEGILGDFRRQFKATTDDDVAAWHRALRRSGRGTAFKRGAVEGCRSPLRAIRVANREGNSIQDLRLTLVGWRVGQMIGDGTFVDRRALAAWLRRTLG